MTGTVEEDPPPKKKKSKKQKIFFLGLKQEKNNRFSLWVWGFYPRGRRAM